ncbi:MAG: hypothetical protein IH987_14130 [Planctomycetes bacterium]|nr:hypothetical protein [Planctomycetota bacterium]
MKNTPIDPYAAHEIREIVARVLREVSPEPPLNTDEVLERLKLDLSYFSLTDPSLRQEMVHRIKVGAIELAQNAAESLFSIAEKAQVWGLWLPWKKGSGAGSVRLPRALCASETHPECTLFRGCNSYGPLARAPTHRRSRYHGRRKARYRHGRAYPWPGGFRTRWTTNKVS